MVISRLFCLGQSLSIPVQTHYPFSANHFMFRFLVFLFGCSTLLYTRSIAQASFTAPDTVCINTPVNITNTSVGAATYFWNFCSGSLYGSPVITNLGNIGGQLNTPTFMATAKEGSNYYGFVSNFGTQSLLRLSYGTSLLNTPTVENLGTFAGAIPSYTEGIQIVQDVDGWHVLIVGGADVTIARITKIDFGATLTNPAPTATNYGNVGSLNYPVDLYAFQEGTDRYALTVNYFNNTVTRFAFGPNFQNPPVGTNLGNIGSLNGPTGICAVEVSGNWYVFITNEISGTLTRLDFGNSLLNTPVATNIGNPDNVLSQPRDLCIINDCGSIFALVVNRGTNDLVRLDFNNGITGTITGISLGNGGNLSFPHSISSIFREGNSLYAFITNVNNATISRLEFNSCTNASIPSAITPVVAPILYNKAGTYTVNLLVNESLPSQTTYCKNIVVMPEIKPTLGNDTVVCNGGTLLLDAGDATHYLWSTGATTRTITASASGTYRVDVSNGGCTGKDTIVVTIADPITMNTPVLTNIDCNTPVGKIEVHPTGGVRPFHYYLNGVDRTTDSVYNVAANNYTVRVVDAIGCEVSGTYAITGISITPVKLGRDTVLCAGMNLTLNAGAGYSSYLWNTTAVSQTIVAVTTGTYFVEAHTPTCITRDTINVTISAPVTLNTPVVTDIDCNNVSGIIEVHPAGGVRPYHYYLNGIDRAKDSVYTSLIAGKYIVRVVDSIGCEISGTYKIVAIPPIVVKLGSDTTVCAGTVLTLNAGPGFISYLWNTTEAMQTIAVASSGSYYVEVSDGDCFGRDTINIRITDPMTLNTPVITNIDCGIPFGKIEVHPSGGIRPYTYYVNGTLRNSDSVYNNLTPGNYLLRVVDSTNCEASMPLAVTENTAGIIRATGTGVAPTCYGKSDGSIDIQVQKGTAPFEYAISGQAYQPAASFTDLAQGTYRIYIRNAVCIDSVDVQLIAPVAFKIGVTAINEICERGNGSVGVTAAGGVTPYSIFWDNVLLDSSGVSRLSTGTYALRVVDANSCGVDTTINIYNVIIPPVHIMNHDTIVNIGDVFQLNAVNAIDYQWTPVDGLSCTDCASPFARPLKPTTYIVRTVTGLNCVPADTINIILTYNRSLYAPSAFTPNNDGQNDVFRVKARGVAIYRLSIYNRWGQRIYLTNDMNTGWNGFYMGELQPAGGYVYMVEYAFFGDEKNMLMQKGALTLIR